MENLSEHFNKGMQEIKALVLKRDDEIVKIGKATEETGAKIEAVDNRLGEISKESAARAKELDEKVGKLEAKTNRIALNTDKAQSKHVMELVTDSEEYKAFTKSSGKRMDAVEVKSFYPNNRFGGRAIDSKGLIQKDVTSIPASGGALIDEMRLPQIIFPGERLLTVRDLLPVGVTGSNVVEYPEETVFDNQAGPQEYELEDKAKSDMEFELKKAPVETLAHYVVCSRQLASDVAAFQSYASSRLMFGLKLEEELQILQGDGTGGTLNGLINQATAYDGSREAANATLLDRLRWAIAQVRVSEYTADGIILNHYDKAAIDLTKGSDGQYVWVNAVQGGGAQLWRLPVIESNSINEGEFLVGAFMMGAQLWDREQASVRIADQHEDLFVKNGLVILAEERLALTVYRPQAFVTGNFTDVFS